MDLADGAIINQYRILSPIGKGGMGDVYLAQDSKLDRQVALKILPPAFAEDKDRMNRFAREAKSVSALNHPNILTIFEFGADGDVHFIAAEFVRGETLREKLKGGLTLLQTLEIAIQIASALQAAHEAGIIHRDIKPENVMIREDGIVKVLDFGLAKLVEQITIGAEAETLVQDQTQTGMVMGTAAYMSPEQARGARVDARSDIFSFGCVLYEALCGRKPFAGETINHTIVAIMEQQPVALSELIERCPAEIERITGKCLAKDARARYQTAKDLLNDLKEFKDELSFQAKLGRTATSHPQEAKPQNLRSRTTPGKQEVEQRANAQSVSSNQQSIAVLPFTNMSADEDNEYFCDGLAEELLNALAKIENLKVAARTSAFSFKGKDANISEIGEKLSVKTILEGSVRKSGNRVRITVQLINVADGYHLWSEVYDRKMQDVFAIQDEITATTIDNLKIKLLKPFAVDEAIPAHFEAYNACLKGRHYLNRRTAADILKSVQYFEQSISLEPNYAPAFSGLADSYNLLGAGDYAVLSPGEAFPKAKQAATRALEIDPSLANAHTALGWATTIYDWDLSRGEQHYLRALELNPGYATTHHWYGMLLAVRGDFDKAVFEVETARRLDPLSPIVNSDVAWVLYHARRYDEAIAQCRETIELAPDFSVAHWNLGQSLREKGMLAEAIAEFERADELSGGNQVFRAALAHALALSGKRDRAIQILESFIIDSKTRYVAPHAMVMIYIGLGDYEQALQWLERAYEERTDFVLEAFANPAVDPLRDHAHFQEVMQRLDFKGFEPASALPANAVQTKAQKRSS